MDIPKYFKDDFESFDTCEVFGVYDKKIVFSDFFSINQIDKIPKAFWYNSSI